MAHRTSTVSVTLGCIACLITTSVARAQEDESEWSATAPASPPPTYQPPPPPRGVPHSPRDAVVPAQSTAEVRFEPDDPSLRLMTLSAVMPYQELAYASGGWWRPRRYYFGYGVVPIYVPLCEGPCTLRLMKGPYRLALAKPGGTALPLAGRLVITGPSTLRAQYVDRSGYRTAGYISGVVGGIGGLILIATAYDSHAECDGSGYCYTQTDINDALLGSGIALFVGAAITASILISQEDDARLTIAPLHVANFNPRRDPMSRSVGSSPPHGAAVSLTF